MVTGAGNGLGRAYARDLAARGAAVVVNDRDAVAADRTVEGITRDGGTAVACPGSVATPEGAVALTDTAQGAFGTVDIVINNAGIVSHGYFEDLTLAQIDEVMAVDLRAAFLVTQPAWRVMKAKGYGRVVMTGSASGMFSHQGTANYAAAKAGLYGLTKALAFEGRDHGIAVNMILPTAHTSLAAGDPIPDYDRYRGEVVLRRDPPDPVDRTSPEANAPVAVYLASPACTVTGEVIDVCFGRYGRVFVGVADGWVPEPGQTVAAEDVEAHLAEIRDLRAHRVPMSYYEELADVGQRLRDSSASLR